MQIAPGTMVDRYHVSEMLGEGGMAIVYKATDTRLKREVALKVIRSEVFPPAILEQVLARFEREATALARMQHPNILTVFDFGEYQHSPYLVSEYMAGGTLRKFMNRQVPAVEAARLLLPVAEALSYAHVAGVVHRDVKPSNVLFTTGGVPKLADFGIARLLGMDSSTQLTGTGMGMGTPAYMAPEQWHGEVSPAVDTYALGVVFYEMLTGRLPYEGQTPVEMAIMMATKPLPDPRLYAAYLTDEVVEIVSHSLQQKPENRFTTMANFIGALQTLTGGPLTPASGIHQAAGPSGPHLTPVGTPPVSSTAPTLPPESRPAFPTPFPPPTGSAPTVQTPPPGVSQSRPVFPTPPGVSLNNNATVQTPPPGVSYPVTPPGPQQGFTPPAGQAGAAPAPGKPAARLPVLAIGGVIVLCLAAAGISWFGVQQIMANSKAKAFEAQVATGLAQTAVVEQAAAQTAESAATAAAKESARQTEAAGLATAHAEATQAAINAAQLATQNAVPSALQGPVTWPVIFQSDFVSDNGDWTLGDDEDEFAVINRAIRNGMLLHTMTAKQGVASRTIPETPSSVNTAALSDFYLSVDMVMSGPTTMQGGVVFRYNDSDGYYVFLVNRTGEYSMWSYDFNTSSWTNVVEAKVSSAISINGLNRIEVLGRGSRYMIYVNRTLLVETAADFHTGGWAGVVSELADQGDKGEWRFDNFVVRAP